jgi:DNA-binding MarR family transcriptional regulator
MCLMVSATASFSPGLALNKVAAALSNQFAAALKPIGIRPSQYGVLRAVAAKPGVSQQHIGETIGLAPSWIMSIIDELEGSELVERRPDPADRRKHQVHLTPSGRTILARANAVAQELDAALLSSIQGADRGGFLRGLRDAISFLELDL